MKKAIRPITKNKMEESEIEFILSTCTGSEVFYKRRLFSGLEILYTEGIHIMAEVCRGYFLIDAICSYQPYRKIRAEKFQTWIFERKLYKNGKGYYHLEMRTDAKSPFLVKRKIAYSKFPLCYIKLYLVDGVLSLSYEHSELSKAHDRNERPRNDDNKNSPL